MGGANDSTGDNSHIRLLVRESNGLDSSLESTERILSNASSIKTSYGKQRDQLMST
jgi:hypothetical protein